MAENYQLLHAEEQTLAARERELKLRARFLENRKKSLERKKRAKIETPREITDKLEALKLRPAWGAQNQASTVFVIWLIVVVIVTVILAAAS